jgi:flavin-dependent dehydrogenase
MVFCGGMQKKISIAGGGLAGLTLGLLLRREDVPVEIWDAGSYPRARVCGEFISGKGFAILHQLGLPNFPTPLGSFARSVRFFEGGKSSAVLPLPREALAVDRAVLDELLAREFQRRGGLLRENCRWTDSFETEGLVRATGRRLRRNGKDQFLGLKVHARDLPLTADLELHFSDEGYVGFSRRDEMVNVCGLFRATVDMSSARSNYGQLFSRVASGPLKKHLQDARCDSFAAVAGISLKRERASDANECRIGDSICMIPPLTGNGMSLAIESAACAAPILREYSHGEIEWGVARKRIAGVCDKTFTKRLFFAGLLQSLAFRSGARRVMLSMLQTMPRVLNGWFALTR